MLHDHRTVVVLRRVLEDHARKKQPHHGPVSRRIPLVPRSPPSPDLPGSPVRGKDKAKEKSKKDDSPVLDADIDEKLLMDAHSAGLGAVEKIVSRNGAEAAAGWAEVLKGFFCSFLGEISL